MIPVPLVFPISLLAGFVGAMTGMGGGIILIPALTLLGVDIRRAIAISILSVIATSSGSASAYVRDQLAGLIEPGLAAPVILGVVLGAFVGTRLLVRSSNRTVRRFFLVILLVLAFEMILRGLRGAH